MSDLNLPLSLAEPQNQPPHAHTGAECDSHAPREMVSEAVVKDQEETLQFNSFPSAESTHEVNGPGLDSAFISNLMVII